MATTRLIPLHHNKGKTIAKWLKERTDYAEIIKKNKGAGYERWAKRYNLKQTAKALCFIKERGINTLSELIDQTDNITKCYNLLSDSLHKKQERLNEIDELNELNQYLQIIDDNTEYKQWYFGHYHSNIQIDSKHSLLYSLMVMAGEAVPKFWKTVYNNSASTEKKWAGI